MPSGNIAPSEQRKRLIFGVFAVAAASAWALTGRAGALSGALVLVILFWFGVLGLLQARTKT
jgi:hypothetical protein